MQFHIRLWYHLRLTKFELNATTGHVLVKLLWRDCWLPILFILPSIFSPLHSGYMVMTRLRHRSWEWITLHCSWVDDRIMFAVIGWRNMTIVLTLWSLIQIRLTSPFVINFTTIWVIFIITDCYRCCLLHLFFWLLNITYIPICIFLWLNLIIYWAVIDIQKWGYRIASAVFL